MIYLVISSEYPPGPGGIGQHAASFVNALAQRARVCVLTNQDYAELKEIEDYTAQLSVNVSLTNFALRKGRMTSFFRIIQAIVLVSKIQPNVIYVSGRFPMWIGALLKYCFPKILVYGFVHGTEITLTGSFLSKVTKMAYIKLDKIIAVSNFTKSLLHSSVKSEKVMVLPNGVDNNFLVSSKKMISLKKYAWSGEPKLLTVGNVTSRKGQHRIISALPEILKTYPQAHYHIVGLPTEKDALVTKARSLNVEHSITFHGRLPSREDLYRAYVSADLFVMLSENQKNGDLEGFGIAILEANAFGLPAIGALGCGIEDAISEDSGVLVDGSDTSALIGAMDLLLTNKKAFSEGARQWAERHNWADLIKQLPN